MSDALTPPAEFHQFYQKVFPTGRWQSLYACLGERENQVSRLNLFSGVSLSTQDPVLSAFSCEPLLERAALERTTDGLFKNYIMDFASVLVAHQLSIESSDRVLDMCAAPGGKTLILAEKLFLNSQGEGELIANEMSKDRRERLTSVLQNYIPRESREKLFVTGRDGGVFSRSHKNYFDKILLNAPCSGERYLLQNAKELKEWSPRRSEKLAFRQYALLSGALEACKKGGEIVYSTCALSPLENDEVIGKLLHKKKERVEVLECRVVSPLFEKTEYGYHILPDRGDYGPLYFSRLKKKG